MLSYDQSKGLYGAVAPPSRLSPSLGRPTMSTQRTRGSRAPHRRHIWIITGPAGCGKTTVAQFLSARFPLAYVEGDEFHSKTNIEKMAAGIPLADEDRWDWLILLRQQSLEALNAGAEGVVLTCSALKRKYRDVIRIAAYNDQGVAVHFIHLQADEETLVARVKARQGHYMKESMVRSQFKSLEEPTADERDVKCINVTGSMAEVRRLAEDAVSKALADDEDI